MLQPLQSRYALLKPHEILYGTDRGLVSSSDAFLSGDWRKSKIFLHYPNDLRLWVNGNAEESWQVDYQNVKHDLPPFGWLAVGADGFYECSESVHGKRYDRVSTPECVFIDGRGMWRNFDGIATAGSVAVRRAKEHADLSVTTIEGVDRLAIARPDETFATYDVRTTIDAIAQSEAITVRAFDYNGKDLGEVTTRPIISGWEIRPPASAVRLDIAVKAQ